MGLRVQVYRHGTIDCTNGGISSKADYLTVMNIEGPFQPCEEAPAVLLENHVYKSLRIIPAEKHKSENAYVAVKDHRMAGGNYAATSDSRFTRKCQELSRQEFYGAVAIHDRME